MNRIILFCTQWETVQWQTKSAVVLMCNEYPLYIHWNTAIVYASTMNESSRITNVLQRKWEEIRATKL